MKGCCIDVNSEENISSLGSSRPVSMEKGRIAALVYAKPHPEREDFVQIVE